MNKIKKLRSDLGITRKRLAECAGCTPGAIGHYENGRRTPNITVCRTIVSAFSALGAEFTLDDIFPPPREEHVS
ncbi:helix-turn-helix transcriptional regulator [Xenorhabdus budapestensis]|uniref:Helix-turn-helix transcriptional regulator n=1 Tax=Xenorhabdus budapestensis TaxID=290110 RepID=A0ABX7VK66_XENBU|nr:helix-turn-helix transcriptional regulator [Xenorhabdus budapestensis]QTL40988.1 helix-turn-helix transcriptional regulator [Xenorhabdus budapestensis]